MTLHIRPCLSFFTRCTTQTPILSLALSKGQLRLPTSCTYHSQQITKQLRKCSFTDTTYLNTDFCMEIYPRLRSISHDVVAKADKSKNSSKTTRCHARPELDFGSSIKEQTNKSRRPQSGSAPYVSGWIRSKSVLLVRQCGCLSTAVILSWAWMQQILSKGKGETPDTSDMAHALGCLVWQAAGMSSWLCSASIDFSTLC